MPKEVQLKLKEGDPAPEINSVDHTGKPWSFPRGKWIVLYFYPKDDTPGCTTEACGFRDDYSEIQALGAEIVGVSTDTTKAHQKFIEKFTLPFTLLADTEKKVVQDYGVWGEKSFMGRKYLGTNRVTFLIDPKGIIRKIWPLVKPAAHAKEIIETLKTVK